MITEPTSIRTTLPKGTEPIVILRDIVRGGTHRVLGREPMLRVPYDLYAPAGPVEFRGGFIHYALGAEPQTGSVALATLADAKPGERVLVRVPPCASETEWWLCEVEARNGVVNE